MWWVLSLPVAFIAVGVALVPGLWVSVRPRDHSMDKAATRSQEVTVQMGDGGGELGAEEMRVTCPLCDTVLVASSGDAIADLVGRLAWRSEDIPSATHVLESAVVA